MLRRVPFKAVSSASALSSSSLPSPLLSSYSNIRIISNNNKINNLGAMFGWRSDWQSATRARRSTSSSTKAKEKEVEKEVEEEVERRKGLLLLLLSFFSLAFSSSSLAEEEEEKSEEKVKEEKAVEEALAKLDEDSKKLFLQVRVCHPSTSLHLPPPSSTSTSNFHHLLHVYHYIYLNFNLPHTLPDPFLLLVSISSVLCCRRNTNR